MNEAGFYLVLADVVLVLHLGVVLFVVGGLVAIVVGNVLGWHWVNARGLRIAHLVAIAIVVAEAWAGLVCPLTALEQNLRARAGAISYGGDFISHWMQRALYYDLPAWVFVVAYTLFGMAVAAAWWCYPPRRRRKLRPR